MFSKRGSGLISEIFGIFGTIVSICIMLYVLKWIGIDVNLGEILVNGLQQLKGALEALKSVM